MANFWNDDDGEDILETTDGSFDAGGGNFDPIPEGTNCLAAIDDAKWNEDKDGNGYISLRWSVQQPAEYENRKVFHKLWVEDDDPSAKDAKAKRTKAKRMLAAIDSNAGGKLGRKASRPGNDDLMLALANKAMVINLGLWEIDGKDGNWVRAVNPKASWSAAKATKPSTGKSKDDLDDDDVPF